MAAFVQTVNKFEGGHTSIVSPSITLTAGNFVVVFVVVGNSTEQHVSSVTDTLGNTYQKLTAAHTFNPTLNSGSACDIFYAENVAGGATTITASWPAAGGFDQIVVGEYSGIVTSSSLDIGLAAAATFGLSVGPMTLSNATDLLVAFWWTAATGCTVATGFTDRSGGGATFEDKFTSSSGAVTVAQNSCGSGGFIGAIGAFKIVPPAALSANPVVCVMQ